MTSKLLSDFVSPMAGMGFHPDNHGFTGTWPLSRWGAAQQQYAAAYHLVSGNALKATDKRTKLPLYPLGINLWDFIAEIHATMVVGEGADCPPQTNFVGDTIRAKKRAARYARMIDRTWGTSDPALFWTIFYNTQVYGGYGMMVRMQRVGNHPLKYEAISPFNFYPVLDSNYNIVEFFIHRRITHSEAKWHYGVAIEPDEEVWYVEYWNPERYDVKINNYRAKYRDGTPMVGDNPFKVAPAVYVPHQRKTSEWGASQILGIKQMVLEFNARLADVSDGVRDSMDTPYWAYNVQRPKQVHIGRVPVWVMGEGYDARTKPEVNVLSTSRNIRDGSDFVNMLWDMILHTNSVPPVALGVDEGSQRSGTTLRARFWALEAHASVERLFAESQLSRLARITIAGMHALGEAPSDGGDMEIEQVWKDMLPQDRLELVNEMVQRKAAGLISSRRAIQQFGDVPDVDGELEEIRAEQEEAMQRQMKLREKAGEQQEEKDSGEKKKQEDKDD